MGAKKASGAPTNAIGDDLNIPGLRHAFLLYGLSFEPADRHAAIANPPHHGIVKPGKHVYSGGPLAEPSEHDRASKIGIVLLGKAQVSKVIGPGRNRPMPRKWLPVFEKLGDADEHDKPILYKNTVYQFARAQLHAVADPYYPGMDKRSDIMTAARVDATLILLPLIGWMEASRTLSMNGVPVDVAARVMTLPMARRRIDITPLATSPE